ncbi:MAG: DeoR/GlpR transcriptional regulator [Mycoplasmataceae bacterium]|nr:DeoR/GlpR transcriptional regulator [Mycoplasmataceae bacterium]
MSQKFLDKIKEIIKEKNILKPKEIEDQLNLTTSTCRRYLIKLEESGFIKREFGEIIYVPDNYYTIDKDAKSEIFKNKSIKQKLAKKGAFLAKNYDVVFVDSSSTNYYLFEYLDKKTTIYTNSLLNANHAINNGFSKVNIISGLIKVKTMTVIPTNTIDLQRIRFPIAFIGVNAISTKNELMTTEINEGMAKKIISEQSDFIIILAEKEKFNHTSIFDFTSKTHTLVITDNDEWPKNDNFNVINSN